MDDDDSSVASEGSMCDGCGLIYDDEDIEQCVMCGEWFCLACAKRACRVVTQELSNG